MLHLHSMKIKVVWLKFHRFWKVNKKLLRKIIEMNQRIEKHVLDRNDQTDENIQGTKYRSEVENNVLSL